MDDYCVVLLKSSVEKPCDAGVLIGKSVIPYRIFGISVCLRALVNPHD